MYYGAIDTSDIANGEGVRVTLFVSGCRNRCDGCFQPETWSFDYGREYTEETEERILDELGKNYISGLTLLGGEPFEPENQRVLTELLRKVSKKYPDKNIWVFTGYTLETLLDKNSPPHCEVTEEMLHLTDVLVDGPFVLSKRNIMLKFRGSENQRVIDVKKTLAENKICLYID